MAIPPGKSAFLICGDDDFRVETTTREILDALVPADRREFGLEVIDGRVESVGETTRVCRAVRDALISDGLFGGGDKTVWLREPSFLSIDRIAKSEETKKNVAALTDAIKGGLPDGVCIVVSTLKINRGSSFFKAFGGKAGAVACMNSLKQCAIGLELYASDNKGFLPAADEEEVEGREVGARADGEVRDFAFDPAPGEPLLQAQHVAAVAVEVQHVGIEMADLQFHIARPLIPRIGCSRSRG